MKQDKPYMTLDSAADFRELTQIKICAETTGLFMVGGGVPKNFAQDTVVCAEVLGYDVPMHEYAVQITVADSRDGACSSSTLKEASSWGKVETVHEQMVYAEATTVVPLIASYAYHKGDWIKRKAFRWANLFKKVVAQKASNASSKTSAKAAKAAKDAKAAKASKVSAKASAKTLAKKSVKASSKKSAKASTKKSVKKKK
jgi:hypothetical protein